MSENKLNQVSAESKVIPKREEINQEYKWDLTQIFRDDEEWEKEFKTVSEKVSGYQKFEGKLAESAENLIACFRFDEEINIKLDQLHLYAMLSKDSDMRVGKYHSMDDRIKSLYSKVGAASSFIRPELLKIQDEKLQSIINSNEDHRFNRFVG